MESVLSESPDQVLLGNRAARLIANGAKIKSSKVDSLTKDAIPFYIDDKAKLVIFSTYQQIHGYMEYVLVSAASKAKNDSEQKTDDFDKKFKMENMFGCVGLKQYSFEDTPIYFYGLNESSVDGIKKYLIENFDRLKNLKMRTFVNGKEAAKELCGRIWPENNIISFWNEKSKIDPYMSLVNNFTRKVGMNPNECAYEFLDSKALFGYDDLRYDVAEIEKVGKEEMTDLLKKQHLDPNAKKKLRMMSLEDPQFAVAEQRIKLKDLIQ